MPGKHTKGTNDADSNGKKGGSLPEEPKAAKARDLGKEIDAIKDLMRRNGWSV